MGSVSNEDIFKYLTGFRKEISKNIKQANENMKEEITTGVKEMKKNLDKRMTDTDSKIEDLRAEAEESKKKQLEQQEWMPRMESRMRRFEKDKRREKHQQIKENKLQQMESQPARSLPEESVIAERLVEKLANHFPKPPHRPRGDFAESTAIDNEEPILKSWSGLLNYQLGKDTGKSGTARMDAQSKAADRLDEQERNSNGLERKGDKTKNGMKALKRWFGDETISELESSDSDNSDWGQVDRRKRNKQMKKRLVKKKSDKVVLTLNKPRHILGIGPLTDEDLIDRTEKDFNKI